MTLFALDHDNPAVKANSTSSRKTSGAAHGLKLPLHRPSGSIDGVSCAPPMVNGPGIDPPTGRIDPTAPLLIRRLGAVETGFCRLIGSAGSDTSIGLAISLLLILAPPRDLLLLLL